MAGPNRFIPARKPSGSEASHSTGASNRLIFAGSATHGLVDLVEQRLPVGEVEVLGQVAVRLLARLAVEGHVQGDEPGALDVAAVGARVGGAGPRGARGGLGRRGGRG